MKINMKTWGNRDGLYRSGRLDHLTSDELEELAGNLRGGTIIDLRTPGRAEAEPDPELPDVNRVLVTLPPTKYVGYSALLTVHRHLVAAALEAVLEAAEGGRPVLVHCTEGKDRTGVVCALAETLAGINLLEVWYRFRAANGPYWEWDVLMAEFPGYMFEDWRTKFKRAISPEGE